MKKILFLLVTFFLYISNAFAHENILTDYIENGIKYFSKKHSKSFDLNIEIKYPKDWKSSEGSRPHVVQKFVSKEKGSVCVLLIDEFPEALSHNDWLEISNNTEEIKEIINGLNNPTNCKITPTLYSSVPGNLIEFKSEMEQAGVTLFVHSVFHNLYYKDKMISLQCSVVNPIPEIAQRNFNFLYPIFRSMGNDIIVHNKYTDPQIKEYAKKKIYTNKTKKDLKFQQTTNTLPKELDKLGSYSEMTDYLRRKIKDDDISAISIPLGFFYQSDILNVFCSETGYVPQKFIAKKNSYKKSVNLDNKMIEYYKKIGMNNEEANSMLKEMKELLFQQGIKFLEKDYTQSRKIDITLTKKDYCQIYDEYADEIINYKIKEIKNTVPNVFNSYFKDK